MRATKARQRRRFVIAFLAVSSAFAACASAPETSSTGAAADAPTVVAEPVITDGVKILAHRGVHQTFSSEGVDDRTCTATRIDPPVHEYMENTLPSMEAAFAAGAAVVEIDIAPTSDGVLAVFHDWDVGCRTNLTGEIRSLTWDELSQLDVGYGYTSNGETYPLRGQGQGLMPRLEEVFATFPEGQFLINFKSDDPAEAALLQEVVEAEDATDQVWAVYGAPVAVDAYIATTETRGFSEASIRACLGDYLAATDTDLPLPACQDTVVVVPTDIAPVLTGWPDDFIQAMASRGTDVILSGPGLDGITGVDTRADLDLIPDDIDVYVWTDKVEALP